MFTWRKKVPIFKYMPFRFKEGRFRTVPFASLWPTLQPSGHSASRRSNRRPHRPPRPPRAHPRREEKRREAKRIARERAYGPSYSPAGIPHQNGPMEGRFARQGHPAPTPGVKRSGAKRNASLVSAPVAHGMAQQAFRI